jgi:hypothetical protein
MRLAHLSPFALISAAVVALCWWFSLYVLTTYPRSSLARSLGAAIALLGAMGLGETMVMTTTSAKLFVLGWRIVFVASSLLPVLWLQINIFLLPQDKITWGGYLLRLGWPLGVALALLGAFTNTLFDYDTLAPVSGSWKPFHLLPGILALPWHAYLIAYLGLPIFLATHLFQAHETLSEHQRRRLRLLFRLAAFAFECAGCYAAAESALWMYWIELPVWGVQTLYGVGVGALAIAALRYTLFTPGRRLARSSAYSLVAVLVLALLYVGVLVVVEGSESISPLTIFLLVAMVASTHMLFDWGRSVLDPLFFDAAVVRVRRDLRRGVDEVALAPNLESALEQIEARLSRERFSEIIRDALRSRGDPRILADCARLLQSAAVEQRAHEMGEQDHLLTDIDRGRVLWDLLVEAIECLRPPGKRTTTTRAWRRYLALQRGYVDGRPNRKVAWELNIGLRTLDRDRNAGADAVAEIMWQTEERTRSEMARVGASP